MCDSVEAELPKLLSMKKPVIWKDFKKCEYEFRKDQNKDNCATEKPYITGDYLSTLARFFYKIKG